MRHIFLAATALAMLSGAAYAQSADSNSGSRSTAINSSASQSRAISNPKITLSNVGNSSSTSNANSTASSRSASLSSAIGNQSTTSSRSSGNRSTINISTYAGVDGSGNSSAAGGSASGNASVAGGGGGASDPAYTVNYSGGYTLRNVPEVIPPNVVGGNPCSVGASAGMSMAGFGIAGGATWADKQCERRQQAALLFNIGKPKAAAELLCQDDNIRAALRVSGEPCTADQAQVATAAAIPVAQVVPAIMPTRIETPPAAKPVRPEWCYTAGPAELRHHAECNVPS